MRLQPLTNAWDTPRSVDTTLPDAVELDDFLCADADFIAHECSDDAVIDSVRKEHAESGEEDGKNQAQERLGSSMCLMLSTLSGLDSASTMTKLCIAY